jgi:hypothetical protein
MPAGTYTCMCNPGVPGPGDRWHVHQRQRVRYRALRRR